MNMPLSVEKSIGLSGIRLTNDKKIIEMGKALLNNLISSMKIAQIYDPNNKVFLEHIQSFDNILREIFRNEGEAVVDITANHIFFNKQRLPMDFASYRTFHFLMDGFFNSEIGEIRFEENISKDELISFVSIFSKSLNDPSKKLEDIEEDLEMQGIVRIQLQEPKGGEEDIQGTSNIRKVGKQMYTKSIMLLKEMVGDTPSPRKIQTKLVRRLVQNIIDAVIVDETYMLALTNIKNHYDYTLNHCLNVCVLSTALGCRMGMERKRLSDLGMAALFHDIGKIFIPEEILTKPAKLTDEEFEVIKSHPLKGAEMLTQIKRSRKLPVRAIVVSLEHHKGVDQSGYPRLFFKKELNLFSKIIAIADVFDATTTPRIYQKTPFKRDEALGMMMKESGTKFGSLLLKAFINMIGVYPIGCLVLLNSRELAVVVETNQDPDYCQYPKIKLITEKTGERIDGPIIDLAYPSPRDAGKRFIVKSIDPFKYGIDVTAYL